MKNLIFLLTLILGISLSSCFNDHKSDPQPATQTVVTTQSQDTSVVVLKNSTWIQANECTNTSSCILDTSLFSNSTNSFIFYKFTSDSLFMSTTEAYNHYADTVQIGKYLITDFFSGDTSKVFQRKLKVLNWESKQFSIQYTTSSGYLDIKWFVRRK